MTDFTKKAINREIVKAYENSGLDAVFSGEGAMDLAAEKFADAINPISMKYNIEIGANIFVNTQTGAVYLSDPVTDYVSNRITSDTYDTKGNETILSGLSREAVVHTHFRNTPGADKFSDGDYDFAFGKSLSAIYVATPMGNLHKWNTGTKREEITIKSDISTWE